MSLRTLHLMLATIIVVALLGCPRPAEKACEACADFEAPLVSGAQYGAPAGHSSGDVIFTANSIPVSVYDFTFTGGGGTFNEARVETPPAPFGSGQTMRTNNINLEFDFSGLTFTPSEVQFEYLDLGGFENLSVNGSPVFAGDLPTAPVSVGGVSVAVYTAGDKGFVILTGAVQKLRVGGQEFWIDNVCARQ